MTNVVIVEALRTPIGSFNGSLASLPGHKLGEVILRELVKRAKLGEEDISEVILGQVLTGGCGQNPARQASLNAGISKNVPAWGMNQVCGSGLRAIALGAQAIVSGDSTIVIAGGQESMSASRHSIHLRDGVRMGNGSLTDMMISDGLTDAFHQYHMGITAENVAKAYDITREEQDALACASQNKAEAAQKAGAFAKEIVPITISSKKGDTLIDKDEFPRHGTTIESLAKLRPAFTSDGTVTAGNASGINDGAAAVVLMPESEAKKRGLKPLARIVSWAHAGVAPEIMGTGPIPATQKALHKANWSIDQLDLIEANEAFAAQAVAVNKTLGWDVNKVNVHGGAIALGHPIGASGARILVTLVHAMHTRNAQKGIATLCVGGGMGVAVCIEKC